MQELEVIVKFYVIGIIGISPIVVFARESIFEQLNTYKIQLHPTKPKGSETR